MKKILVAEDDRLLNNAYRLKLTKVGFEVRSVGDGDEAISVLSEFVPDLILLDLMMPGKDGFTTLAELKASEAWKNIPVIVASNLGQPDDIEKAMKLGATDFVIKSDMSMEGFVKKINEVIPGP